MTTPAGVPRPRGMRARGAPGRTAPTPTRGDHGQHSHPQCPALLPRRPRGTPWRTCRPHRPPQPASHPAPRRRRADTRTDAVLHTRAGRRATWTAHDDYLLVLSSTHTSCQRHRRARVVTRHRLWRQHRPSATATSTGLLPCETGGWCHPFSRVDIDVDHKKRVDLGVLRGADHDGLGAQVPFEMVSVD